MGNVVDVNSGVWEGKVSGIWYSRLIIKNYPFFGFFQSFNAWVDSAGNGQPSSFLLLKPYFEFKGSSDEFSRSSIKEKLLSKSSMHNSQQLYPLKSHSSSGIW